jgi:hypothetical protein
VDGMDGAQYHHERGGTNESIEVGGRTVDYDIIRESGHKSLPNVMNNHVFDILLKTK